MGNYTSTKATNTKVRETITESKRNKKIRDLYATGSYSYRSLARIYKISHQRVAEIVNTAALDNQVKGGALNG